MSTTSPNFGFVLATTSDTVSVTSHISNNFSSVDSILSTVHTGSGQFRASVSLTTPILINPVLSGTINGGAMVMASTGNFSTITATGGLLTVNAFSLGTYGYPAAVGSTGYVLSVVTGNAVWATNSPNTGANLGLSNLASVAINTNMNTFTAGLVTMARVIATSGALTGLTVFQASTGTFIGNVVISGTATVNVMNCTGGAITAGGITIGTYALPATIGSTGQVLATVTGNAVWSVASVPPTQLVVITANTAAVTLALTTGKMYKLTFAVQSISAVGFAFGLRFNASSGANYAWGCNQVSFPSTGTFIGATGATLIQLHSSTVVNDPVYGIHGEALIIGPQGTQAFSRVSAQCQYANDAAGAISFAGGQWNGGAVATSVTITNAAGVNFAVGRFVLTEINSTT